MEKYIRFSDAIKAVKNIPVPNDSYYACITSAGKDYVISELERVQAETKQDVAPVVHGRWEMKSQRIINKETGAVQAHYIWNECSLCRKHNQYKTDYCPYCGAKMGESEGE